jgi:hypothetical protein
MRFFELFATRRRLLALLLATLVSGAAMLPAMQTMSDHGFSVVAFEGAGSVRRSSEILAAWGEAGKQAAWWQLAVDFPFLLSYGLLAAASCAAIAGRARRAGKMQLARAARVAAWLGPLAATLDLIQNISLALVLSGQVSQPWPRISAICMPAILVLEGAALVFAAVGWLVTREVAPTTSQAAASPDRR